MLSIQLFSIQIDISWSKPSLTNEKLERYIHTNQIEKQIDEMKTKSVEYIRFI